MRRAIYTVFAPRQAPSATCWSYDCVSDCTAPGMCASLQRVCEGGARVCGGLIPAWSHFTGVGVCLPATVLGCGRVLGSGRRSRLTGIGWTGSRDQSCSTACLGAATCTVAEYRSGFCLYVDDASALADDAGSTSALKVCTNSDTTTTAPTMQTVSTVETNGTTSTVQYEQTTENTGEFNQSLCLMNEVRGSFNHSLCLMNEVTG
ncbi:hypothetical protein ElyMa_005356200 [Elysia marginata]|uniref:Apple domain-containing protein n=1 Tax=Elysia marginata TaxID=1093978 RepID=A0AAV4EC79_9GAST|nr:hypothetical protein ElyMa_005356200 [Elysia marginata]